MILPSESSTYPSLEPTFSSMLVVRLLGASTCFLVFLLFSTVALSEDLLLQDDVFESETLLQEDDAFLLENGFATDSYEEPNSSVSSESQLSFLADILRFTFVRQFSYGNKIDQSTVGARIELDTPLWQGAYARLDYQINHYYSPDSLSRGYGDAYTNRALKEAWIQLSHSACVAKLGKQALFWGRVEGAYALDVISPLDFTKPLLTDFSDIRQASEMALFRCYFESFSGELFYQSDTKLNRFSHFASPLELLAKESLGHEWGGRFMVSNEMLDVSVNFAQLYTNQILVITDRESFEQSAFSQRYRLYGLSLGISSGSIMYEIDFAHKTKQLASTFGIDDGPERREGVNDVALGFEYLSPSNHQINGGVWRTKILEAKKNKNEYTDVWNLTWSKSYLNDTLDLSLLATWLTENDTAGLNLSTEYDVNDHVQVTAATSYSSKQVDRFATSPDSKLRSFVKLEVQF